MENPNLISVVIITYNESENIARCIQSVKNIADEILIVDSLSTDNTVEIARNLGANVISQSFLGYIEQKNFAKNKAKHNWILSLDADECLSENLEIHLKKLKDILHLANAYSFNRLTNYCGKWIKHCGWYPDKKLRLFNKHFHHWGGFNPHDKIITLPEDKIIHINQDILHYSFKSYEQFKLQMEKFSIISAQSYFAKGKKASWLKIYGSAFIKFIKSYILKLGFLDGKEGWIICSKSTYYTYLKYKTLRNFWKSKTT
jgi:glycosyltransferase involved in cell wall biosynthesis